MHFCCLNVISRNRKSFVSYDLKMDSKVHSHLFYIAVFCNFHNVALSGMYQFNLSLIRLCNRLAIFKELCEHDPFRMNNYCIFLFLLKT